MLDGKIKKPAHQKLHETVGKHNSYMKNVVYGDENITELNKMEYPRNTLLRNNGLPEKLEKHLNNEKERELESLYEENRQLLMEISKLRKTNQLLVKDVNKKNEIIDSLDSSLVEVEEKLENAKKKNWNMYNEILNRERKNQQQNNTREHNTDSNNSDDETYELKASKIGTFNTVNIIKSNNKKDLTSNRPKSTSISTSTENTKWLQDMILESLSEKHVEKKAYDNLKYEVEKLQKEIYSMQTDLLKSNIHDEVIQEPIVDHSNGKLSVFHSTSSSTNNSSSIIGTSVSGFNTINNTFQSTSLAQELKEVNNTTTNSSFDSSQKSEEIQQESEKENEQENVESIPPRSVHILMGKTFSRDNNIDKKINKYKNGPRYNIQKSDNDNFIHPTSNYYRSDIQTFQTQINQQPSIATNGNNYYYYSYSNLNNKHQNYNNLDLKNYSHIYNTNYTNPFLSVSTNDNYNNMNRPLQAFQNNNYSIYNSIRRPINLAEYRANYKNQPHMDNLVNHHPLMTNSMLDSGLNPQNLKQGFIQHQYSKINFPESNLNSIPSLNPFYTQTINLNNYSNLPFPPFQVKITQIFRRNRNNSVPPPRPKNELNSEKVVNEENHPVSNKIDLPDSNNDSDKDLPQGYIRFKTSISSPLSQDDFFSPISGNVNNICPCDKAIDSCAAISKKLIQNNYEKKNKMRSSSTSLPLPIPLIAKNNQFQGTSGLLKFSKY
ncbi:Uncharacterized protein cpbgf_8001260 [Cryptosporidium parvum]|uniref:Uncharacterized protein n=2 Tax=Cryptosporidium parvum TaxID=5807 RepID=A0A7S7LDC0_CRYPV|nr:Uncharacterized protein CPATCC_0001310 [Cryptosporidium parvum]WKS79375.1 hypothetical protein CPCDC_8g1260 [Cryptosporidium sp. 43IA8]WRK33874.1 Uncharacterized protein cpbgf_8001260 [Cryptosporidium parvum]|eukprot:QOY39877.1 hypothetical protein CPATCC_003931 [Cryptosporidium parvum]